MKVRDEVLPVSPSVALVKIHPNKKPRETASPSSSIWARSQTRPLSKCECVLSET